MRSVEQIKADNIIRRRVPCTACGGHGDRDLTEHEAATIAAVERAGATSPGGWTTTREIAVELGVPIKNEALCNRLVGLDRLGQVESRPCPTSARLKE